MTALNIDETDEVRYIDEGTPPARFARGWHCLGLVVDFRDGAPHSVEAFGTRLVVFADSKGEIKILDAYCRHMGGDLSQGTVKGDSIACPFHDWRWGGNGKCTDIPYARRVPPLARTRAWMTMEQDELLFVWHDPEGNPPPADVTIPVPMNRLGPPATPQTWPRSGSVTNTMFGIRTASVMMVRVSFCFSTCSVS